MRWPDINFFKHVLLILTVPAEYTSARIAIMRECAYNAELIKGKFSQNLQFITERKYFHNICIFC